MTSPLLRHLGMGAGMLGAGFALHGMGLGDLLAPLDYPRQAAWNLARSGNNFLTGQGSWDDLMRAAPGAIGAGAGLATNLLVPGAGIPLSILAGSLAGGAAQGLGRAVDDEYFQAPTPSDITGTDDFLPNLAVGIAGDPLTYAGGFGGRAAGDKLAGKLGRAGTAGTQPAWLREASPPVFGSPAGEAGMEAGLTDDLWRQLAGGEPGITTRPGVEPHPLLEGAVGNPPVFYSRLQNFLDQKLPASPLADDLGQIFPNALPAGMAPPAEASMKANALLQQLQAGAKQAKHFHPEELQHSGLEGFLQASERMPVTRSEVMGELGQNKIGLRERLLDQDPHAIAPSALADPLHPGWQDLGEPIELPEDPNALNLEDPAIGGFGQVPEGGTEMPEPLPGAGLTNPTAWSHMQTQGPADAYRELLLTYEPKEGLPPFRQHHWNTQQYSQIPPGANTDNVLASVRFADRAGPAGEKILHMDELQSDWHRTNSAFDKTYLTPEQVGEYPEMREAAGQNIRDIEDQTWAQIEPLSDQLRTEVQAIYKRLEVTPPANWQNPESMIHAAKTYFPEGDPRHQLALQLEAAYRPLEEAQASLTGLQKAVPDAPFKDDRWVDLAMKRMARYAADNGYDRISWNTLPQQQQLFNAPTRIYESRIPKAAEKLARELGVSVEDIGLGTGGTEAREIVKGGWGPSPEKADEIAQLMARGPQDGAGAREPSFDFRDWVERQMGSRRYGGGSGEGHGFAPEAPHQEAILDRLWAGGEHLLPEVRTDIPPEQVFWALKQMGDTLPPEQYSRAVSWMFPELVGPEGVPSGSDLGLFHNPGEYDYVPQVAQHPSLPIPPGTSQKSFPLLQLLLPAMLAGGGAGLMGQQQG